MNPPDTVADVVLEDDIDELPIVRRHPFWTTLRRLFAIACSSPASACLELSSLPRRWRR